MSDATTVPAVRLDAIAVDATDSEKVTAFWAALLGVEVDTRRGPYIVLHPLPGGPRLVFQKTDVVKTTKNRVHVDLRVANPRAMQARVEELGGRRLPEYAVAASW
jgi:predicted enzyme related to lactoylglutathione lyase